MILMKGLIESVYRIYMLALLKFQPYSMYVFDAGQAKMNMFKSEEHTSELQSRETISYAVFCLKKKKNKQTE